MEQVAAESRRETAVMALLPLFFLSGATALAYQTLWVRELQLVFGTSTFAISTVLAAFMAGLAAGGFIMGRYADKLPRPLAAYGILEIIIGVYAMLFPFIVTLLTPAYLGAFRALEPGPVLFGVIQFALIGVALLIPTAAMGATLPLLARFATLRLGAAGSRVGLLYATNTFGAVAGTWVCGFILLPDYGRFTTTVIAAVANLVLGLAAIGLDRYAAESETPPEDDLELDEPPLPALLPVSIAIGLAGFSALVYEVAWTRILALILGASTYTFSIMLLAFLIGIAAGGRIGGPLADWLYRTGGQSRVLYAFAAIEVGIAIVSYGMMYVYPELPIWYVVLFDLGGALEDPSGVFWVSMQVAALVMTPPAILMGLHFPIAVRAVVGHEEKLGRPVGIVYGANTLGGVAGAFLAGFVLLPNLWIQGTVYVAAVGELLAATLLVLWVARTRGRRWLAAVPVGFGGLLLLFVAQRPPWDPMMMTAGTYHYVSHFADHTRDGIVNYSRELYELQFYEEGLSSVVTVAKNTETDNLWLANNGKVDASTTTDMPTQVLCSLLPMQYVDDPEDVLIIGLASGITAGAVSLIPDVETLEIVELEPAIERAALFFGEYNHDVLDDPRVKLIHNDGRNHVLLSAPGTYDVIVSEPSNPWISGVSNLFTREFWEVGKTRLKPGGVWSQWVQMYGMDERDLRILLKTFAEVFPHVIVYATIEDADLVLIGSDTPIEASEQTSARLLRWPKVKTELEGVDIESAMELLALVQMDRDQILTMGEDLPFNTDDNMIIEYSAPLNLHLDTQDGNLMMLRKYAQIPEKALGDDNEAWIRLARAYHERGENSRGIHTMAAAIRRLDPLDERREALLREAEAWQEELKSERDDVED